MLDTPLLGSHGSPLSGIADVCALCEREGIPHQLNFHAVTQPTAAMKADFSATYAMDPLPPTDLPESGGGAIVVCESPTNINNLGAHYHGAVVTAIADHVGNNLAPGVGAIYVHASLNPHYRAAFEKTLLEPVRKLAIDRGISVINTSMGWDDGNLSFRGGLEEEEKELCNIAAFVVDSAGNDGRYGFNGDWKFAAQKHNAVSHAPPLTVHVGAASADADGKWHIEGCSSANSPTLVAPVFPNRSALWDPNRPPEPLTGTSAAAPYASGVLAALDRRYGQYLTREQILYAVLATCKQVEDVNPDGKKTPSRKTLEYITNAAGLAYNPEYAGFGLIQPYLADRLLSQMVALTQQNPQSITLSKEDKVWVKMQSPAQQPKNASGHYVCDIHMQPGLVLKTTLDMEFADKFGDVWLTSPSGRRLPLVKSSVPVPPGGKVSEKDPFCISTTHGFAGEPLGGTWRVESTEPIVKLQMNQHHFRENDIVGQLDIPKLLKEPTPSLAGATPLAKLKPELRALHAVVHTGGLSVGAASRVVGATSQSF